jgi:hypothetical protein
VSTTLKILALLFVVAGAMALVFGGTFTYSEAHHFGPWTVNETQTVNYPAWGGLGLIALGAGLFFLAPRRHTKAAN